MQRIITLLLLLIGLSACKKPSEYFIGKWQIIHMVENNQSIDLIENWMHLKPNGTFNSYDETSKKSESGKWIYKPKEQTLFIDGEGKEGDSQWKLSRKNDTLFFHSTPGNLYLVATKIND